MRKPNELSPIRLNMESQEFVNRTLREKPIPKVKSPVKAKLVDLSIIPDSIRTDALISQVAGQSIGQPRNKFRSISTSRHAGNNTSNLSGPNNLMTEVENQVPVDQNHQ